MSLLLQYFTFALAPAALAVHSEGLFELDGNATDTNPPEPDDDWNSLNHALDSVFIPGAVEKDGSDVTYFKGGGSKDVNDIPLWEYSATDVAPDKDEIIDAFAAVYEKDGETYVYFGADRFDGSGDAFIGFWFFQDQVSLGANGSFIGEHVNGDILVVSDFTNGGTQPEIKIYEWLNGKLVLKNSGAECDVPGDEEACAVVNETVTDSPWPFVNKDGETDFAPGEFYEGGINLDTIFGGDAPCFSTFLAETRSSASTSAQLKDFALGSLSTCVPPTVTTQVDDGTADFGQQVTDTATLSGSDGPVSGTVTFYICTPAQVTAAGCPSGGSQVGDPVVVNTANDPDSATSAAYTVGLTAAAAGKYCWRAVYTPNAASEYLAATHTNATTECFTVAPATIEIEKTANPVGPVSAGTSIGFDIVVTNNGTQTTLGIVVSDPLPAGIDWTLGTVTGGASCSITGPVGTEVLGCTKASLAAGASFSAHISGPTDSADCGTVTNTANVATSNDGTDSDGASVVVQCPDVTVVKTPDSGTVQAGSTATFTIVVSNAGPGTATGVTLTDNLPAGYTWSLGGADAAACSINTAPSPDVLSCNFGTLASGASRTITLSAPTTGQNCAVIPNTAVVAATNEAAAQQGNNSDNGSIDVLCANVGIVKTANPVGPVSAGAEIGFDITVSNNGDGIATGVSVSDPLPAGITWTADLPIGSTDGVSCSIDTAPNPDVLTCTDASMPAGASFTVHIHGTTDAADCGTINNIATVSTSNDGGGSDDASVVVQCPDLGVVKTANGPLNAGETATFTIVLTNHGPGSAANVSLTDQLPSGAWTLGGANAASCSINGSNLLTCNFGTVASGASRTITVSKTTTAVDCSGIHNEVTVSASNENTATDQFPNSDDADIVVNCPDVHVLKTADNGTISAGQTAAFTITVSNAGPGVAKSVTLTDNLPAGVAWTEDSASCSIAANVLTCAFGDLASGASAVVHVSGLTDSADCGTLNNTAVVAASNEPVADQSDNSSTAVITVQCPDLEVIKSPEDGTISAGDVAKFTIVVKNWGPGTAFNVHVEDTLPIGVTWTITPAVTGCSINTAPNPDVLSCDFASLASGASVEITINGDTVAANCGTLHNVVVVSASNENTATDQFPNSDDADIVVDCADIVLTKQADAPTINAGDPIGFTIEVTNAGLGTATGVTVTDALPAGITWTADAPTGDTTGVSCAINTAPNPDVLTCTDASMATGDSFSVHIHGVTTPANCGVVNNTAVVTTGNDGSDQDIASVTVQCPDVTVVKTPDNGTVNAGSNAVFTIVVSNSNAPGTGTAKNVTLTDNLPAGYVWSLGGANAASCSINTVPSPDVLSCTFGDLAAGASRTITLTAPTTGQNCAVIPNVASVAASNEAVVQQGNNSDSAAIDVTCPDIRVVKDAPNTPIQVGSNLVFTITTSNIGDGLAEDVVLTDTLPAGFAWTEDSADCSIAAGVLTCDFGDMAPGASATVTLTAPTSDDPETGNIDCGENLSQQIPNVASASSANEGSNVLANNSDGATIVVNCSSLVIEKTLEDTGAIDPDLGVPSAEIGDTLDYTLAYTGAGLLENAVITDVLPQGLAYVDGSALGNADFNAGTYDAATRTITWHAKATLPNPAAGTVSYKVTVLATAPEFAQPLVNVATIDSDQTPPDSDTASLTVLAPPLELTPPPTSTLTPQTGTSNPGFALMLILLGVAGLTLAIGFITPVPARVRRRDRLG